jgi:hypothetical protein
MPLRCDCCGHKNTRSETVRIGDRCQNPYINNGCDGNYKSDTTPNEPGYIQRINNARNNT